MKHFISVLVFLISTSAVAATCQQNTATPDDMALLLSRDLGNMQHSSESHSGLAAIYENGIICFINKSVNTDEVTSDRTNVGNAVCYDSDNNNYASYDFDFVDGWFSECELERRRRDSH